jgi:hypothetical protein
MNRISPHGESEAAGGMPDPGAAAATLVPDPPAAAPRRGLPRRAGGAGAWLVLTLVLLALGVVMAGLALKGAAWRLPVWAVAEAEARMNRALAAPVGPPTASVSLGGVVARLGGGAAPRLVVDDLEVMDPAGRILARLPELRLGLDPAALLVGRIRPRTLDILGARMSVVRLRDGRFDLALGDGSTTPPRSLPALLDRIRTAFSLPALSRLDRIDLQGMTLTLDDRRTGRLWEMGDGQLTVENGPDRFALRLAAGLVAGGAAPARAELTLVGQKASPEARFTVTIDGVAAADLAAQSPALAWLSVLDAPISGRLSGGLDTAGVPGPLQGGLEIGAGALQPTPETRPIRFDRAGLAFSADLGAGRIAVTDLGIAGPALRLSARGQMMAEGAPGGWPSGFLTQVAIADLQVDPAGLFEEPVRFSEGAIDLRLVLDPFRLDIGQVALREDGRQLLAEGRATAEPQGWNLALDLSLNEIGHDRLLALWPVALVPQTRNWLADNLQQGLLFDVRAALRLAPGAEPRLSLGYEFAGTDVRVMRTLPPVRDGVGHAAINDQSYVIALDEGSITPPAGGPIDVAGSVFRVRDIRERPATAELTLNTRSSLTAALSLLDEPPFRFLTKAGRAVDLAEGRAVTQTRLTLPLMPKLTPDRVGYSVFGTLYDVTSDRLVPGRTFAAGQLALTASRDGLTIAGPGRLGGVPFDATYALPFGPAGTGTARVEGRVELSQAFLSEFGIALPEDMVSGQGQARIAVDLPRGTVGRFTLDSDLQGIGLRVPALGWTKRAGAAGLLEVEGRFGTPPVVDRIALAAAGLDAEGSVTLRPGGALEVARFSRVTLGNWLNVAAELRGRGAGREPAIALTDGRVDLRGLPQTGTAGGAGPPLSLTLDRLTVSDGIALTGFRGDFTQGSGLAGDFTARVNGGPLIAGTTSSAPQGTALRVRSTDAGAVLQAAGIFGSARGGALDLTMVPGAARSTYDGQVQARNIVVVDAPALAELLSLISVIGLLDQMNSSGLVFSNADAEFRLTPERVEIRRGAAVGASLGVSMEGVFDFGSRALRLQGVISPIYLLNSIGSLFTRRGEGVFGFNYDITGTADRPRVSVNPLSILTPGMFREIFRQPMPPVGAAP